jgi:hypothetical protein
MLGKKKRQQKLQKTATGMHACRLEGIEVNQAWRMHGCVQRAVVLRIRIFCRKILDQTCTVSRLVACCAPVRFGMKTVGSFVLRRRVM